MCGQIYSKLSETLFRYQETKLYIKSDEICMYLRLKEDTEK